MSIHVDKRLNRHWKLFIDKWSVLFLLAVVAHHGLYSWGTAAFPFDAGLAVAAVAAWLVLRSNETLALRVGDVLVNLVLAALVVVMADSGQPEGLHRGPALLESLLLWMPAAALYWSLMLYNRQTVLICLVVGAYAAIIGAAFLVTGSAHAQGFGYSFSRSVIASALIMLLVLSFLRIHFTMASRRVPKTCNTVSSPRDQLTDLFTRGVFEEQLQKNAQAASRLGATFSLVIIGIDKFKPYNAEYGHQAGDQALCAISRIISARIRKADVACRWGGEVFAIILPLTSIQGAMIIAESLRAEVERHFAGQERPLTVSTGVCEQMKDEYPGTTFQRADNALKLAKQRGANQMVASGPTVFAWEETHFYN